jgi:branched-chain amino acid transport system substrate-binding protein
MGSHKKAIMKFVLFFSIEALILTLVAPPVSAVEPVKVGINIPLSGKVASIGHKGKTAMTLAAKKINDAGGIKSLNGAKLELFIADCESKPEVCGLETERLITKEGVSVIVGAYLSGLTIVGSQLAEKYEVPWINWIGMSSKLVERNFRYFFRPNESVGIIMLPQARFMKYWENNAGRPVKTYFPVYVNDAMGKTLFVELEKATETLGLELSGSAPVAADITDFTPIMLKIKAAKPDVLWVWQHEEEAILFTKAMAIHKLDVPLIMSYGTFLNEAVIKGVGNLNEGWFQTGIWNSYMKEVSPWVNELAKDYETASGGNMDGYVAQAYQCIYLIADAFERAASRDPKAIRDALAKTKVSKGDKAFICGYPIEFAENGQNPHPFSAVMQTWKGKHHTVYPPEAMEPAYKPVWQPKWAWLN